MVKISTGLTVDPSRRQCPGQHPVTSQRIQHYRQIPPHLNRHPKSIPLPRLTVVYRKRLSNPFGGGRQVKDQHWWPPLSALLRPIFILPPISLSNIPRELALRARLGGGMLLPSRETYPNRSRPSSRHISPAAKFPGRLPPTCFPASPVASSLVEETSGGVAYVRTDFVEDMLSLLPLFPELARLTTVWPELQLLPWNKSTAICLHPLGVDFGRQSLRKFNPLFSIFLAQASASPTCHISH